jgi:hypothetical protein
VDFSSQFFMMHSMSSDWGTTFGVINMCSGRWFAGVYRLIAVAMMWLALSSGLAAEERSDELVLTHADAAVLIGAGGLFRRELAYNASVSECVAVLNRHGIYFGLLEVLNGSEFTKSDCARVMGQIDLILSGEAVVEYGRVKLPKFVASWEELCMINDVNYAGSYSNMLKLVRLAESFGE